MDDLWRHIWKLLVLLSLLLGSGELSKMSRQVFKKKVEKKLEEWKSRKPVQP